MVGHVEPPLGLGAATGELITQGRSGAHRLPRFAPLKRQARHHGSAGGHHGADGHHCAGDGGGGHYGG
jgi:hypothetical protein